MEWSLVFICTFLLIFYATEVIADDFYEILGVSRQADDKEIRRAFKKIALKMHPDKNQDDPEAHNKFLKINRAYEVLKDGDLRKKYDTYGEDGLKEDGPSGRGYQSWNFYQNDFGIYDDDPEVITLSKADFEVSVEGTDDIWFINFYSPRCSHCHDLAPTWREVARELEGVIRIGAINCGDDRMLCQSQGIRSYPSLLMYPGQEKYQGDRTRKQLVKHALQSVGASMIELWTGNFKNVMSDSELNHRPWLVTFCGDGGDCLEKITGTKLAAMFADLVNVGTIDCNTSGELCEDLGVDFGTYYYKANQLKAGKGVEIESLDAKDIMMTVLNQLPDIDQLKPDQFKDVLASLEDKTEQDAWLIHFVEGSSADPELRKLPSFLENIKVGRVDCRLMRGDCNELHVNKFPAFLIFKSGGGHEFHHGRQVAHDIAAFARDGSKNPVKVLGPSNFPHVAESNEPWFVDFYAPWCPPCMRLLPEFRKASKAMRDINFGTVDCTTHTGLCQQYNVRSYPTTIFYNQSRPHIFNGHHHERDLVEFLEDTLKPPVRSLTPLDFDEIVAGKPANQIFLVDFFSPSCAPCMQLAPEWRRLAKSLANDDNFGIAMVDCQKYKRLCQVQGVQSYPTIRLYPHGSTNPNKFHLFNGWFRDAKSIKHWAYEYLPSPVIKLDMNRFNQEIASGKEPWIIDFYAPWCGACQHFDPEFKAVARKMEGRVKAGKVDCDREQRLCQVASINSYPTVRYFAVRQGTEQTMDVQGQTINSMNAQTIINYLEQRVPKVRASSTNKRKDEL